MSLLFPIVPAIIMSLDFGILSDDRTGMDEVTLPMSFRRSVKALITPGQSFELTTS